MEFCNKPPAGLFRAPAHRLEQTIAKVTSWLNHHHRDHSQRFTDRTGALRRARVDFNQSDEAWAIWEELCALMGRWAPPGHYFCMVGEPDAAGWAWYGWVPERPPAAVPLVSPAARTLVRP